MMIGSRGRFSFICLSSLMPVDIRKVYIKGYEIGLLALDFSKPSMPLAAVTITYPSSSKLFLIKPENALVIIYDKYFHDAPSFMGK